MTQDDKDTTNNDKTKDPLADALKKAKEEAEKIKTEAKATEEEAKEETPEADQLSELEQMKQTAQRAVADLANFKRRAEEEKMLIVNYANANLLQSIIPSLDNFNRAIAHLPKTEDDAISTWIDGITNTFKQLQENLAGKGLSTITTVGENFDPNRHEAVLQGPGKKDKIIEEMEAGYVLGERVIRPAKVKVGNGEKE